MPNITKLLILSTAHIKPDTLKRLNDMSEEELPFAGAAIPFGFFLYAHDENCGVGEKSVPEEIFAACVYARKVGCEYIRYDCDEEPIDALPVYEHG